MLKEYCNPYDYDFIVLSRLDGIIIEFPELIVTKPGFYRMANHPGIADQMFIFSPEFFDFLNVYDNFDELNEKGANYTLELMKVYQFQKMFPGREMEPHSIHVNLVRSCLG